MQGKQSHKLGADFSSLPRALQRANIILLSGTRFEQSISVVEIDGGIYSLVWYNVQNSKLGSSNKL